MQTVTFNDIPVNVYFYNKTGEELDVDIHIYNFFNFIIPGIKEFNWEFGEESKEIYSIKVIYKNKHGIDFEELWIKNKHKSEIIGVRVYYTKIGE